MSPKNENGKNTCQECGFTCASGTAFNAHLVKEHGAEAHQCQQCQSKFADKSNLRRHMNNKHNMKSHKFHCTKCNRDVGKRKDNARRHERQHGCHGRVFLRTQGSLDGPPVSIGDSTMSITQPIQMQPSPAVDANNDALGTNIISNPDTNVNGDFNLDTGLNSLSPELEDQLNYTSLYFSDGLDLETFDPLVPETNVPVAETQSPAQMLAAQQQASNIEFLGQEFGYASFSNDIEALFPSPLTNSFSSITTPISDIHPGSAEAVPFNDLAKSGDHIGYDQLHRRPHHSWVGQMHPVMNSYIPWDTQPDQYGGQLQQNLEIQESLEERASELNGTGDQFMDHMAGYEYDGA